MTTYVYLVYESTDDDSIGDLLAVMPSLEAAQDGVTEWQQDVDDFGRRCWFERSFGAGYWVVEFALGSDVRRGR